MALEPFVLSLSKDERPREARPWFDRLTTNGRVRRVLEKANASRVA